VTVLVRKWVLRLAFMVCSVLPVRERVVLASNHSSHLRGNLKCIHDEMNRQGLGDQAVLLLSDTRPGLLGKASTLLHAVVAEYYLATSRVFIVDDYYFPIYVITPKPQTTIIQTWHASGAFKKIGYSVLDKSFGASEQLVRHVHIHSNYDHILIGSKSAIPAYSEAFGQPAERFVTELGIPRTDLFFDAVLMAQAVADVRAKYKIPSGKKVLLYAPTFRGDSKHEAAYHDDLDLELVRERCGAEWVLLLRLHPFVSSHTLLPPSLAGFAFDVSDHADFNELMLASDMLVTDYSSAIFEYALLDRPMAFFAPDFEAYQNERGFYFSYADVVPGPIFGTTAGLADYVAAGVFDTVRVAEFRRASFDVADGHASERVVRQLVAPALKHAERGA
jgi:teichoic acid ribitol-phosphate primase